MMVPRAAAARAALHPVHRERGTIAVERDLRAEPEAAERTGRVGLERASQRPSARGALEQLRLTRPGHAQLEPALHSDQHATRAVHLIHRQVPRETGAGARSVEQFCVGHPRAAAASEDHDPLPRAEGQRVAVDRHVAAVGGTIAVAQRGRR